MKENKGTSMMDVDHVIDHDHHTPAPAPAPNAKRTSGGAEGEGDADADEWTKVEKRKAKKAKKAELRHEVRSLPPSLPSPKLYTRYNNTPTI